MCIRPSSTLVLFTLLPSYVFSLNTLNEVTGWQEVEYDTPSDYLFDQQTGQPEADMVGQPGYGSFFKAYDNGASAGDMSDDYIGFRLRVRTDAAPSGFTKYGFVGIDADNNGSIDVFVGGNQSAIRFYSPGDDLNVSPDTTSLVTLSDTDTYLGEVVAWNAGSGAGVSDFSPVSSVDPSLNLNDPAPFSQLDPADPRYVANTTTADLDGGLNEDYFFSFQVSMDNLMKAVYVSTLQNPNKEAVEVDLSSVMSYIAVTSTQDNALNQDLNGQDGNALNFSLSDLTWAELGASSNGSVVSPVPEFSAFTLIPGMLGLTIAMGRRRR